MSRIVNNWRIAAIPGNDIIVIGKDLCHRKIRSLAIKKILPDFVLENISGIEYQFVLEDISGMRYQLKEQSSGFWKRPFKLLRPEWYDKFVENNILYGCMN